ncbi:hypothetical protein GC170_13540 [bacterium]|nr:hypothetical protein [bacterium]
MSYFAIATRRFDLMLDFYSGRLRLPVIERFERPGARGAYIDLGGGSRMELIDAEVQKRPLNVPENADDRLSLVIETDGIERLAVELNLPEPEPVSWGARVIRLRDPDGIGVWFIEWNGHGEPDSPAVKSRRETRG